MNKSFGKYIREVREELREERQEYSVRKVAGRLGVQPSYLSKVERGEVAPPSEATIVRLAAELEQDADESLPEHEGWELLRDKRYGGSRLRSFRLIAET